MILPFLLATLAAACACPEAVCPTKDNPEYCDGAGRACAPGLTCVRHRCTRADGGGDGNGGSGGDAGGDRDASDTADAPDSGDGPVEADAPMSCKLKEDCPPSAPICSAGKCLECEADGQCTKDPGKSFCRANLCVGCGAAGMESCAMRSAVTPVCTSAGKCVECEADGQCTKDPGKSFCLMNLCVGCGAAGMGACAARSPATPVCGASGKCVECEADGQCTKDPGKSFCRANLCVGCSAAGAGACGMRSAAAALCAPDGTCVECLGSGDCTADASRPICDTAAHTCAACATDGECAAKGIGAGVCMADDDGRCAGEAETIYVENKAGCSDGGTGTKAAPFCSPDAAETALKSTRRVVVIRGAVGGFSWSKTGLGPVTVVGQSGAMIAPGATGPGAHVTSMDVLIRNLAVSGSLDTGVIADGSATIRLDAVTLENNAKGGLIVTDSAGYDVVNCIFDANGPGLVGPAGFGGAYLGSGGAVSRFEFNTVVDNKEKGVVCEGASLSVVASLLSGNLVFDTVVCTVSGSKTTSDGDPKLGSTNRLTAASPCRNFVASPPADAPAFDIDGNARPQEGVYDCGASEYKP